MENTTNENIEKIPKKKRGRAKKQIVKKISDTEPIEYLNGKIAVFFE